VLVTSPAGVDMLPTSETATVRGLYVPGDVPVGTGAAKQFPTVGVGVACPGGVVGQEKPFGQPFGVNV